MDKIQCDKCGAMVFFYVRVRNAGGSLDYLCQDCSGKRNYPLIITAGIHKGIDGKNYYLPYAIKAV